MKNNYSAPVLEQVRMESEMPVMVGSAAPSKSGSIASMQVGTTGAW